MGLLVIKLNFSLARAVLRGVDLFILCLSYYIPAISFIGDSFCLVEEVVGYAELLTVFSVRSSKLVVHVLLATSMKMLQIYRHLSFAHFLQAFLGTLLEISCEAETSIALQDIVDIVYQNTSIHLNSGKIAEAFSTLEDFQKRSPLHNSGLAIEAANDDVIFHFDDHPDRSNISLYVKYAVASYGQCK